MAAAGISCRVFTVMRLEMTRVLSVTSLSAPRKYRNETWCRRWWSISRRGLSTTAGSFAPSLGPILAKESRESKDSKRVGKEREKSDSVTVCTDANADVTVTYHRGMPRVTVPLPSRREKCMFTLKPITHTVGDLLDMLKVEDRGIDRACITTLDDVRISSSNTIESLLESDFKLIVNDNVYTVSPPDQGQHTVEHIEQLSDVQTLVGQLYESLHVREHNADLEKEVIAQLEEVRLELEPLEQKRQELEITAARRANMSAWAILVLMSMQFGILARLTWWEYSWDIMEPITYFVTYGTAMGCYIYFLLTRQEYMMPDVMNRRHLLVLHKKAKQVGLDLQRYNMLKDQEYELETTLKIIRGPLWQQKNLIQQRRRERQRGGERESRSRSPSSSPSPSPSPDRNIPKKTSTTTVIPS